MTDPAPAPKPRKSIARRLLRVAVVLAVVLALLVAVGPLVAGPVARQVAETELRETLGVDAEVGEVTVRHSGSVRVADVRVPDERGGPLLAFRALDTDVHLKALARGRYELATVLDGLEVDLVETEPGRWNWQPIADRARARGGGGQGSAKDPTDAALPDVACSLEIGDARVSLTTLAGRVDVVDLDVRANLRALDQPAVYSLSARTSDGGLVSLDGEVTLSDGEELSADTVTGTGTLLLEALLLEELAPALALVAPVDGAAGTLAGGGALTFGPDGAAGAELSLTGAGLELAGAWSDGALSPLGDLDAGATVALDGAGTGPLDAHVRVPGVVDLAWSGAATELLRDARAVEGRADVLLELAGLDRALGVASPLREGVELDGRVVLDARPRVALTTDGAAMEVALEARVEGLGARRDGAAVDLAELADASLALEGALDLAAGTVDLTRLALTAGPVTAAGRGGARGIGDGLGALEVEDTSYDLTADLDRLAALLAPLSDAARDALGGQLTARGEARTQDGVVLASGTAQATALRAGALGPLDLDAQHSAEVDLGRGGRARLSASAVAAGHTVELDADLTDALDRDRRAGTVEARAHLADLDAPGALPGLDAALPATARDVQAQLGVVVEGRALAVSVSAAAEGLVVPAAAQVDDGPADAPPLLTSETGSLEAKLDVDLRRDRVDVRQLALVSDLGRAGVTGVVEGVVDGDYDVDLVAQATAPGLVLSLEGGGELDRHVDGELALRLTPAELDATWTDLLRGHELRGEPLSLDGTWRLDRDRLTATGGGGSALLRVLLPVAEDAAPGEKRGAFRQTDLALAYDLDLALDGSGARVRQLRYASQFGELTATGDVDLAAGGGARADLAVDATGDLARVVGGLGDLVGLADWKGGGALTSSWTLTGSGGELVLAGDATLTDVALTPPEGAAPAPVDELTLTASAALDVDAGRVRIDAIDVASSAVSGGTTGVVGWRADEGALVVEGLSGDLTYVPTEVGALLAPWLPGELSGDEAREVTFRLDGGLERLDLASLLAAAEVDSSVALGTWTGFGVEATGSVTANVHGGVATASGDLTANGGALKWDLSVDGRRDVPPGGTPARSQGFVKLKNVRASGDSATWLASLHPLLSSAAGARAGEELSALVTLEVDVAYEAPLDWETLVGDPLSLSSTPLYAEGFARFNEARLSENALLGQMLQLVGIDDIGEIRPRRVDFELRAGRVGYTQPWKWVLGDVHTEFTGSIGLDRTLDLAWSLPVTKKLVQKEPLLRYLEGETISIPVTGTVSAPDFGYDEFLPQLLDKALKKQLEEATGGILGGGGGGQGPGAILQEADRLWDEGKPVRARKLYQQLKDDYRLSLVYVLNKDRIDERARE